MPDFRSYRVTPIKIYLEKTDCESFIWFNGQYIELALDKPLHHIPEQSD